MDHDNVQRWLQQRIAQLLEVSSDQIDPQSPMENLGLGSKDATAIVADLDSLLNLNLPVTLLYEHETIESLATHIAAVARTR